MLQRLKAGELTVAIEIPPGFGRALRRASAVEIADGATFIASAAAEMLPFWSAA